MENSALMGNMVAMNTISLIIGAICIVAYWVIFKKAGEPGWAAIVPIYNIYTMLKIVGKPWWWMLLLIIPFVNIVIGIMVIGLTAKVFGKSVGFAFGLFFLPFIFFPILAWGDAKYIGPNPQEPMV
ncbi:MAG: DUF5684 domain-containing protein [bacterium]